MRLPQRMAIFIAGGIVAAPAPLFGSFINIDAAGKATIRSYVKTGYQGRQSTPRDFGTDTALRDAFDTRAKWRCDAEHAETAPFWTADTEPEASAHGRTTFTFGRPIGEPALDTVNFQVWAIADANGARNHAHNSAAARVDAQDSFSFTTIAGRLPAGSVVGKIHVGPLRELEPYEKLLRIDFFKDGELQRSAGPGSRGFTMSLLSDSDYQLRMLYRISVPHRDPEFSVGAWATLQTAPIGAPRPPIVPEPGSACLLVLAGAELLCGRGRRKLIPG